MALPLLLWALTACHNTPKQEETQPADKGIAFEVFQHIPKEELDEKFWTKNYLCPEDCYRHFGDDEGNDADAELFEYNGNHSFNVDCFPLNDGGWFALLVNEGCFDGCSQTVHAYRYKDGVLSYASNVLPRPTFDEMIADPFLISGIDESEIDDFKAEWGGRYLYYVVGDTLTLGIETLNYDDMLDEAIVVKRYVWNGEAFDEIASAISRTYNIIDYEGLGSVKLGGIPPASIPGYNIFDAIDGTIYSRNDGDAFKTLLGEDGTIEAIHVYANNYAHNGMKVGDTLNRLVQKPGHKAYFKDGTFVVTDETGYDNFRIDYVGTDDALDGTFAEGPIDNPKFKPDATVEHVCIYKHRNWENDTCDMRALRDALDDPLIANGKPDYGKNDFHYVREFYNDNCEGYCDVYETFLHCYPLKSGGFKAYKIVRFDGFEGSGYLKIEAFIFKNGVITEVEPEPDLVFDPILDENLEDFGEEFVKINGLYFYDRTMTVVTGTTEEGNLEGIEFTWDGTNMKKTFEGTFEN